MRRAIVARLNGTGPTSPVATLLRHDAGRWPRLALSLRYPCPKRLAHRIRFPQTSWFARESGALKQTGSLHLIGALGCHGSSLFLQAPSGYPVRSRRRCPSLRSGSLHHLRHPFSSRLTVVAIVGRPHLPTGSLNICGTLRYSRLGTTGTRLAVPCRSIRLDHALRFGVNGTLLLARLASTPPLASA